MQIIQAQQLFQRPTHQPLSASATDLGTYEQVPPTPPPPTHTHTHTKPRVWSR